MLAFIGLVPLPNQSAVDPSLAAIFAKAIGTATGTIEVRLRDWYSK